MKYYVLFLGIASTTVSVAMGLCDEMEQEKRNKDRELRERIKEREMMNSEQLMRSIIHTQYQIQKLTREMNNAYKVASGSEGHYRVVRCSGNIRLVEPTIKYEAKQQQLVGENGRAVEVTPQAKL
jgi:hypothetical protein